MQNKLRLSKKYIAKKLFYSIIPLAFAILVFLLPLITGEAESTEAGIFLFVVTPCIVGGIAILSAFFSVVNWFFIWYYIEDQAITIQKGIFFKQKITLAFSKINSVKIGRTFIDIILGTSSLMLDSGSMTNNFASEVNLLLQKCEATKGKEFFDQIVDRNKKGQSIDDLFNEFENQVLQNNETQNLTNDNHFEERGGNISTVKIQNKHFWQKTLTNGLTYLIPFVIIATFSFIVMMALFYPDSTTPAVIELTPTAITVSIFLIVGGFILSVVISILASFTANILTYGNFQVSRQGNLLKYKCGILRQIDYSFDINRLHAIKLKQGFIRRIFGYCSIECCVIGIGGAVDKETTNSQLSKFLFPICKKSEALSIISTLVPEFESGDVCLFKGAPRTAKHYLFYPSLLSLLILSVFCFAIISFMSANGIGDYFYIAIIVFSALWLVTAIWFGLRMTAHRLGWNENVIKASTGSFSKTTYIIKNNSIQKIDRCAGMLRRLQNVCTIKIHFKAEPFPLMLLHFPRGKAERIKELVITGDYDYRVEGKAKKIIANVD